MTEIIPIAGTPGLEVAQGEMIAVKPICEALGLDAWTQITKLKKKSWVTTRLIPVVGADGKNREMFCINKDAVPMWLANIDENRVKPETRPMLITYQKEAAKALNDYFTKGVAINPQATTKELLEYLHMAKGLIADDRLATRAELVLARAMGDAPEIAHQDMPLYVETYLRDHGRSDISSGGFGRKLAKLYRETYHDDPPVEQAEIGKRVRPVKAYREAHRHLFNQVLTTYK